MPDVAWGTRKDMKDQLMAELPMDELSKVNETISQIPTSPQQVAHKLMFSAIAPDEKQEHTAGETPTEAIVE